MLFVRKVEVALGEKSYTIYIGNQLGVELAAFLDQQGFSHRALLIADTNTGALYGKAVLAELQQAGLTAELYEIPAGESSKSLAEAEKIFTRAIELGLDRNSPIFALGGGVVGDLAGFIAATYMRGVPFIQLPTSLLAQVDSSVGGKVAVNHQLGKNLIGAFYQPKAVFMDLSMLATLPEREIYTGLGEIIKYGIIYDRDFFAFLEDNAAAVLALEPQATLHMIARSCEIKAAVVAEDEKESGLRMILNFGHTMAHAIEKNTGYTRYNHGEAVAIGMVAAARISAALGLIGEAGLQRVIALIERLQLPTRAEGCSLDALYAAIFHDKKTIDGRVNWVLMESIGQVRIKNDVPEAVVRSCMAACLV